ncbi:50S ribosomal protein L9 [Candidatus Gracilibacteria bacterium]|nr:50S ribosomal protein L9 [Candidatus Gracilibacteria bacterium]
MKVLFLENVLHVAKKGEIKEVKPGYAMNMLFPKKVAVELTPEVEKKFKDGLKKDDAHRRELLENRHNITELLNGKEFNFTLRTGTNNKVFGAIGEKDIIQAVKKQCKIEVTKKHILLPNGHIKQLGETQVYIKLGKDAQAKIKVIVNPEA